MWAGFRHLYDRWRTEMMLSSRVLTAVLVTAVGSAAYLAVTGLLVDESPETRIGTAGVVLGDDTARIVERVDYRQDVERVGDMIITDGVPRDEPTGDLAAVWAVVGAVWPHSYRDELAQVSVVREKPRGLVGVVHRSVTGDWILSLDLADLADRALIEETIVHELSHVVTLDDAVFTFGEVEACSGVAIALGCAEQGSVLARFAERFWPGNDGGAVDGAFVNDYAATAAHEDLAESFTASVLGWPIRGTVVEAKIEMLAADPALAELAASLRVALRDGAVGG